MWSRTYGEEAEITEIANSVIETSDGGFALAGNRLLIKTDAFGNMIWNRTIQDGDSNIFSMVGTPDGGYTLGGTTRLGDHYREVWLVKTDSNGFIEWNKTYGEGYARSLITTSEGGYTITGRTIGDPITCWLLKTDALGNTEWRQYYPGNLTHYMYAKALIQTTDGGYR